MSELVSLDNDEATHDTANALYVRCPYCEMFAPTAELLGWGCDCGASATLSLRFDRGDSR